MANFFDRAVNTWLISVLRTPLALSFFQVSPAKFAWLVHSLGVALASLSPISSWVGLQIGYTNAVLDALGISPPLDGFLVVLRSLPFRFFPLFYICLILIVLVSGRDFGQMAQSESSGASALSSESQRKEAGETAGTTGSGGGIMPKSSTPLRSTNALVPFAAVIAVTFGGMILDGIAKIEDAGNEVRRMMCWPSRAPGQCEFNQWINCCLRFECRRTAVSPAHWVERAGKGRHSCPTAKVGADATGDDGKPWYICCNLYSLPALLRAPLPADVLRGGAVYARSTEPRKAHRWQYSYSLTIVTNVVLAPGAQDYGEHPKQLRQRVGAHLGERGGVVDVVDPCVHPRHPYSFGGDGDLDGGHEGGPAVAGLRGVTCAVIAFVPVILCRYSMPTVRRWC